MRTNEERAGLVHKRTAEIKAKRQNKKQRAGDAICIEVCRSLVVETGSLMSGWTAGLTGSEVQHASGAASLVGSHAELGYILMGLFSFILGICVTVLLYRLHRRNKRARQENPNNEL